MSTAIFYELDRLFDGSPALPSSYTMPMTLMDLHEDVMTVTSESLKRTCISTFNTGGICGESRVSSEHEESGYAIRERYGRFARILQPPLGVKEDQIKASLENSILTVTFPKKTPEEAPKKITIS